MTVEILLTLVEAIPWVVSMMFLELEEVIHDGKSPLFVSNNSVSRPSVGPTPSAASVGACPYLERASTLTRLISNRASLDKLVRCISPLASRLCSRILRDGDREGLVQTGFVRFVII